MPFGQEVGLLTCSPIQRSSERRRQFPAEIQCLPASGLFATNSWPLYECSIHFIIHRLLIRVKAEPTPSHPLNPTLYGPGRRRPSHRPRRPRL